MVQFASVGREHVGGWDHVMMDKGSLAGVVEKEVVQNVVGIPDCK